MTFFYKFQLVKVASILNFSKFCNHSKIDYNKIFNIFNKHLQRVKLEHYCLLIFAETDNLEELDKVEKVLEASWSPLPWTEYAKISTGLDGIQNYIYYGKQLITIRAPIKVALD